jgi:hypothetical protein
MRRAATAVLKMWSAAFRPLRSLERGMPLSVIRLRVTDSQEMGIAGVGLAMIVVSVMVLVWAFPRLPHR